MMFFRDATWFVYLADGRAEAKCGDEQHAMEAGMSLLLERTAGGYTDADAPSVIQPGSSRP